MNVLFKALYRVIVPVAYLDLPKIKFDYLFVYWSTEAIRFLEKVG